MSSNAWGPKFQRSLYYYFIFRILKFWNFKASGFWTFETSKLREPEIPDSRNIPYIYASSKFPNFFIFILSSRILFHILELWNSGVKFFFISSGLQSSEVHPFWVSDFRGHGFGMHCLLHSGVLSYKIFRHLRILEVGSSEAFNFSLFQCLGVWSSGETFIILQPLPISGSLSVEFCYT